MFLCFIIQESEKQRVVQVSSADKQNEEQNAETEDIKTDFFTEGINDEKVCYDEEKEISYFDTEEYKVFLYGLGLLTNTERKIYELYVEGKNTKEVLSILDITENTLKYHNKNIYGKLGVASRKQLKEIAFKINTGNP